MSFSRRHIDVVFQLGKGTFGADGEYDTVTITGARVSANIIKAGGYGLNNAQIRIYGIRKDLMNQLSTLGKPIIVFERNNHITLKCYSDDTQPAVSYTGIMTEAWIDGQAAPQISFIVTAVTGLIDATKHGTSTVYKGGVDAAVLLKQLADQMGIGFENTGVSKILSNPSYDGSPWIQAQEIAKAADCNLMNDDGVMAIWPKNGSRGGQIPLISPKTGMVGYPAWTANGLILKTLYNPAISYGNQVQVESELLTANGGWTVFSLAHDLESEFPGGAWFTTMQCALIGHVPVS